MARFWACCSKHQNPEHGNKEELPEEAPQGDRVDPTPTNSTQSSSRKNSVAKDLQEVAADFPECASSPLEPQSELKLPSEETGINELKGPAPGRPFEFAACCFSCPSPVSSPALVKKFAAPSTGSVLEEPNNTGEVAEEKPVSNKADPLDSLKRFSVRMSRAFGLEQPPSPQEMNKIIASNRQLMASTSPVTCPIPLRFYNSEDGDWDKAMERWRTTFKWRATQNADIALQEPHRDYDVLKTMFPHFFYGRDKSGNICYYMLPGKMDVSLLEAHNISEERFLWHFMWCMEYCFEELCEKSQKSRLTVILDLEGVGFRSLVGQVMSLVKKCVKMMSQHYPERSFQIYLLNVPMWFDGTFSLIKPMLREKTQKKIQVVGSRNVKAALTNAIAADQLPIDYGGQSKVQFLHSDFELKMRAHAMSVLDLLGTPMIEL